MNFNFNDVKVSESKGLSFVGYGINNDVTIVKVESDSPEGKSPYIDIYFKNTGDSDENATRLREFLSEKAMPYTMKKILQLNNAIVKEEMLKSKSFTSPQDMAAGLTSMWAGKRLRLKLNGEEYMGIDKDGNDKVKTRVSIPMNFFCEAITPDAEFPQISDENSKLTFDKNNPYDYKALAKADTEIKDTDDGLPF